MLFRVEVISLKPDVCTTVNRVAASEEQAIAWAKSEFRVVNDAVQVFRLHPQEARVFAELEKNVGGPISSPFAGWENGRVVYLDLGFPLEIFGKFIDEQIEPVKRLRHLRELSFRGNLGITDKGIAVVRGLTRLHTLILDEMQIGDGCMPHLARLHNLRTLYLGKGTLRINGIARLGFFTDESLRYLANLRNLFAFSLNHSEVSGRSLGGMDLRHMEYFSANDGPFVDEGMKHIRRMTKLRKLDLSNTAITNAGLPAVKRLKWLEDLYLSGTHVSDTGLINLHDLSALKYLGLKDTIVSRDGIRQLKKKLPKCSMS
ncbi:MAG: hypothetical protein HYX68_23740 [Planctomycetes bacterium]|nr:hypothetical protein [Planctomycetota bacterium]